MIDTENWIIAIHADACPFVEEGREDQLPFGSCLLLAEPNDTCNYQNCPRKLILGNNNAIEERAP